MKLSKLKYGKNNPRKISAEALEQIKKSITDFPGMLELRPLIFDPVTFEVLQVIIERMIKLDNTLTVKINGKQYHPY